MGRKEISMARGEKVSALPFQKKRLAKKIKKREPLLRRRAPWFVKEKPASMPREGVYGGGKKREQVLGRHQKKGRQQPKKNNILSNNTNCEKKKKKEGCCFCCEKWEYRWPPRKKKHLLRTGLTEAGDTRCSRHPCVSKRQG